MEFQETLEGRSLINILKYTEIIIDIYCQIYDMGDFLNSEGKLGYGVDRIKTVDM